MSHVLPASPLLGKSGNGRWMSLFTRRRVRGFERIGVGLICSVETTSRLVPQSMGMAAWNAVAPAFCAFADFRLPSLPALAEGLDFRRGWRRATTKVDSKVRSLDPPAFARVWYITGRRGSMPPFGAVPKPSEIAAPQSSVVDADVPYWLATWQWVWLSLCCAALPDDV